MAVELPLPKSTYLDGLREGQAPPSDPSPAHERPTTPPPPPAAPVQEPTSARSRQSRESLGGFETDPWGSPELHRGHDHAQPAPEPPALNGFGSVRSTTNAWSTSRPTGLEDPHHAPSTVTERSSAPTETAPSSSAGSGWGGSLPNTSAAVGGFTSSVQAGLGDLAGPAFGEAEPHARRRSLGTSVGNLTNSLVEEAVTITLLPEKEGMFMFQHRNYEVKSARRGSTVIRRYSDFVWLLDCLQKRYPFRQLPLLPPKRISGTSEHRLRTSSPQSLLTSLAIRYKSMALTFQRIPTRSSRNGVVALSDLPTHWFVIRSSTKSNWL